MQNEVRGRRGIWFADERYDKGLPILQRGSWVQFSARNGRRNNMDIEKDLMIRFEGMHHRPDKLNLPMYTDLVTGRSFMVLEGQTVAGALAIVRERFSVSQR